MAVSAETGVQLEPPYHWRPETAEAPAIEGGDDDHDSDDGADRADSGTCPECTGALQSDYHGYETYCRECGLITETRWFTNYEHNRDGSPSNEVWKTAKRAEATHGVESGPRTTFDPKGRDAQETPLPTVGGAGEDLGFRRKRRWRIQMGWQSDVHNRKVAEYKLDQVAIIGGRLGLSRALIDEAQAIVRRIDGRGFTEYGGVEALAFAALAYVQHSRVHRFEDRIEAQDLYQRLAAEYDVDYAGAIRQLKKTLNG